MHHHRQLAQKSWILMGTGGGSLALAALFGACSIGAGGSSEIDSYERAARTQTVAASRAFLEQHRSSHLVSDLIESLPPDVALQVCGDLPAGTSSKAVRACEQAREALATKGTAPDGTIQLAAVAPMVVSTTASDCVATPAVLPADPTAKAKAKAKRSANATAKTKKPTQTPPRVLQVASAERGNKEVRH